MIFDTHAHYDDKAFDDDRDSLLSGLRDNGIGYVVNVTASMKDISTTIDLAHRYDHIYASVGVHPSEVGNLTEEDMDIIKERSSDKKVVAIGEIGLDYHYPDDPSADIQKKWFSRQIELAKEVGLPLIIHSRDAAKDTFDIMKENNAEEAGGVIHCYSYSPEMAKEYVKLGYYIGVGGVVTFKNSRKLKETVEAIPIERILLETDCPYLAPSPHRGERNSSLYIPYIIEEIAALKGISKTEVEEITFENAKRLYGVG